MKKISVIAVALLAAACMMGQQPVKVYKTVADLEAGKCDTIAHGAVELDKIDTVACRAVVADVDYKDEWKALARNAMIIERDSQLYISSKYLSVITSNGYLFNSFDAYVPLVVTPAVTYVADWAYRLDYAMTAEKSSPTHGLTIGIINQGVDRLNSRKHYNEVAYYVVEGGFKRLNKVTPKSLLKMLKATPDLREPYRKLSSKKQVEVLNETFLEYVKAVNSR